MRWVTLGTALLILGSVPACGRSGPEFADDQYQANSCQDFARQFGVNLDRAILATDLDPDNPQPTGEVSVRLADHFNTLGREMVKAEVFDCPVDGFVTAAASHISNRAQRIAFTHTSAPDEPRAMANFGEWTDSFLFPATEGILPRKR